MWIKKILFPILTAGLIISATSLPIGCGNKKAENNNYTEEKILQEVIQDNNSDEDGTSYELKEPSATQQTGKDNKTYTGTTADNQTIKEKVPNKVIKTADIKFQVDRFEKSRKVIIEKIKKFGAYVSAEDQSNNDYNITNTMTIRVDAALFDSLVDDLTLEASYVEYKKINAQDITEEYIDAQARLKSKKEVEAQYQEILKKANTIYDILQVQQHLRAIREEIESYEGKLKYYDNKVSLSTIYLTFFEKKDNIISEPGRSFGGRLSNAFESGWSGILTAFVGFIYLWPLWFFLGISAFIIILIIKKIKRKNTKK